MSATSFLQMSAIGCCLFIAGAARADAAYRYEIFDYPAGEIVNVRGLNNEGEAVGIFNAPQRPLQRSFLRSASGAFSEIVFPRAFLTYASKISNDGRIVGTYWASSPGGSSYQGSFRREANGQYESYDFTPVIGQPNGHNDIGVGISAINNSGLAVGGFSFIGYSSGWFVHHPSSSPAGTFTSIFDGASAPVAVDINDSGQIAGNFCSAPTETGCLSTQGFITPLPARREDFIVVQYPGAQTTSLTGMNNNGDVVGYFSGEESGFFLRTADGEFRELFLPPGARRDVNVYKGPQDINDSGQIVGYYGEPSANFPYGGLLHGYIATPAIPEAQLNVFFGMGLAFVLALVRRLRVHVPSCGHYTAATT